MADASSRSFAERLARLVDAVPDERGERYSARGIAAELNARYGEGSISHTYAAGLLSGRSENPTLRTITMLAELFGVPVAYFFDDETAGRVERELRALETFRAAGVQRLALRMVGLSERSLDSLTQIVEQVRLLEGLDATGSAGTGAGASDSREEGP